MNLEERTIEQGQAIARMEERIKNIEKAVYEIKKETQAHSDKLSKIEARLTLVASIVSGGVVLVWEFFRRKFM